MARRNGQRLLLGAIAAVMAAAAVAQAPSEPSPPPPAERVRLETFLDNRPTVADPTAHYTLYLPASFDPKGSQPVLLIFDPRGRARLAAELFREAADRYGWILVSSNDTRSDTSWEPNRKALAALWPEIHRLAIDPQRVYAAGFSGGAMVAWVLGYQTGGLAGVIGVGGRLDPVLPSEDPPFVHWGAAGSWDPNYDEMLLVDQVFVRHGLPHWLEIFDGPHRWFPAELATRAVAWMELTAMRQGRAARDEDLIEEEWRLLMAAATEAEESGHLLAAFERYRAIEATFAGLRDVAAARRAGGRLEGRREFVKQRRRRRHWDAVDERFAREKLPLLRFAARPDQPLGAGELQRELQIRSLRSAAEGDDYEAVVAKRRLHRIHTQASFYLPRDWLQEGNYRAAYTVLRVALEIRDDLPHVWYNLACAAARMGREKEALEALASAVDRGFGDAAQLRRDDDLAGLRDRQEFARLLAGLEAPPGS